MGQAGVRPRRRPWIWPVMMLSIAGLGVGPYARAAHVPTHLIYKTSPSPIVAPAKVIFIVITPKGSTAVPSKLRLTEDHHTETKDFKRLRPHDFVARATITAPGTLKVEVLTARSTVLVSRIDQVKKGPAHWGTKIVIGGLFLLGSLYYWRRTQRFVPRS